MQYVQDEAHLVTTIVNAGQDPERAVGQSGGVIEKTWTRDKRWQERRVDVSARNAAIWPRAISCGVKPSAIMPSEIGLFISQREPEFRTTTSTEPGNHPARSSRAMAVERQLRADGPRHRPNARAYDTILGHRRLPEVTGSRSGTGQRRSPTARRAASALWTGNAPGTRNVAL